MWTPSISFYGLLSVGLLMMSSGGSGSGAVERVLRRHRKTYV